MALPNSVDPKSVRSIQVTPEERERILAGAKPFDVEKWQRNAITPSPEELADLDEFLAELQQMRRASPAEGDEPDELR
jgi:hypothetical protein